MIKAVEIIPQNGYTAMGRIIQKPLDDVIDTYKLYGDTIRLETKEEQKNLPSKILLKQDDETTIEYSDCHYLGISIPKPSKEGTQNHIYEWRLKKNEDSSK